MPVSKQLRVPFSLPGIAGKAATLLPVEQTVKIRKFQGARFFAANRVEFFRTAEYGGEEDFIGQVLPTLSSDDVVWDVGAAIGFFSVHVAPHVQATHAFEPDPTIAKRLRENLKLNDLGQKCSVHEMALGKEPGEFALSTDGTSGNSPTLWASGLHGSTVDVQVCTGNEIAGKVGRPTIVKIDIEGAELDFLLGANDVFEGETPCRLVFLETHPQFLRARGQDPSDIAKFLHDRGYLATVSEARGEQDLSVWYHRDGPSRLG